MGDGEAGSTRSTEPTGSVEPVQANRSRTLLLGLGLIGVPLLLGYLMMVRLTPGSVNSASPSRTPRAVDQAPSTASTGPGQGSGEGSGQGSAGVPAAGGSARPKTSVVVCLQVRGDPGYCGRYARDLIQRSPVGDQERGDLEAARVALADRLGVPRGPSMSRPTVTTPFTPSPQPVRPPAKAAGQPMPAPPQTVWTPDEVGAALVAAGFDQPQYRLARDDDPAPHATVLYGVRMGTACLLGWLPTTTTGPQSGPSVVGLLPVGTCLKS